MHYGYPFLRTNSYLKSHTVCRFQYYVLEKTSYFGTIRGDIWSQFGANFVIHIKEFNVAVPL